jgi:hypothetical protein
MWRGETREGDDPAGLERTNVRDAPPRTTDADVASRPDAGIGVRLGLRWVAAAAGNAFSGTFWI